MKTKVQAQRKFAQGAVIPPTLNIVNVSIDRRIDISPNKEKNIFHNRTSAKSLLDIVSFKNLHKHAQPIVLLERLEDRHTLGSKDHSSNGITIPKPITNTVNKPNHEPKTNNDSPRVAPARQNKNHKTRIITPSPPMHLRSRVIKNKAFPYKKKNSIKDRKRVIASARKQRIKKRPQRLVDEFSNDDDQPLTFFRKKTLRARQDKIIKKKKLKLKIPKSVKNSEPSRRIKERLVRNILEVPDIITEIPESILDYVNDMDLTDSDVCPETSDTEPTTSQLDYKPVPGTASIFKNPVPSTSAASIYENPVPGTSSSYFNQDPVPSTSSFIEPVLSTHKIIVCQDPAPETSSNRHQVPETDLEKVTENGFGVDEIGGEMNKVEKSKYPITVAGPSNEIETIFLNKPPFYGVKEIDNWVSSEMTIVSPPSQVSTRKSLRNRRDQNSHTKIDLDICIGSKLSSLAAILYYGPSFYDCLCLNCNHCKNVHELLNQYKAYALATMIEEESLKRLNKESDANAINNNNNENSSNIVLSNIRTDESVSESITIDDDDDDGDIKIIDLTEDIEIINVAEDLPVQNEVGHEISVPNIIKHEMPEETDVQYENPEQNIVPDEMPEQYVDQQDAPIRQKTTIDLEEVAENGFEVDEIGGEMNTGEKSKYQIAVAGPSNEIETIFLKKPPFYGIKEIDNWVSSSETTIVSPPSQVSTRKSLRNRSDQNSHTEIDLDICIGSKLTSLAAILYYGPSFYDCLCLNCNHCKNIHELLKQHKASSLKTMTEEENLKRLNKESDAISNNNNNSNESSSNIVLSNIRTDESVFESITIDDDDDDEGIKTIDLTEDIKMINVAEDLPIQNEVGHEIPVPNVIQHEMPEQNVVQDENPEQNVDKDENPEQNLVPDGMPVQYVDQQGAPIRKKTMPLRRRKRGRGRPAGGPITRQKTQAAVNAKAKRKKNNTEVIDPTLPKILQGADLINAPVFYPKPEEFADPMVYLESVMPSAAQFGLFKVVAPSGFEPPCTMGDNAKFTVTNQYIARLFSRWGPAAREMCTIRAYLASQKVFFSRAPLLDGLEVNLPKLFHTVQKLGGLKAVFNKKKWTRVAEELKMKTVPNPERKFDLLCLKYLLPYDTLTKRERQAIMTHVEQEWAKKSSKMLARVVNPLHQQKRLLGDSDPSDDDQDEDDVYVQALSESEDCVVRGRNMSLGTFKKIADTALKMHFPPGDPPPTTAAVEDEYWKIVLLGTDHVSVNAAFIDTGPEGYGFTKNKNAAYGKHPWNLKMLSNNKKNILRYLGLVSGVTIPSLHVGMVFSTSCWHRDPHGLPWIEYMHQGADKIWYGVPEGQSSNFRIAAETLCPTSCQQKPIWLSSDIAMIPPNLLLDQNVRLSRVIQRPGEFIVVMPRAYSCSISTGFTISESVYFATNSFLQNVYPVFQELRESCEPSTFSLEQLLISMSKDPRTPRYLQQQVHGYLNTIVSQELVYRNALKDLKVPLQHVKRRVASWNLRDEEECQVCRTALYLSRVTGVIGKKSELCQQHALRVLNDRKEEGKLDLTGIVLEVSMTGDELDEVIRNLQKQLLSSQ